MRVLVTGGAGFKGVVLVEELLRRGNDLVTIYDNFQWGVRSVLHLLNEERLRIVKADLQDFSMLARELSKTDCVINLAGVVGHPECFRNPRLARMLNTEMVEYMCKYATHNVMFIQASTGSVYGKLDELCTERSPTIPLSVYGETKLAAEKYVLDFGGVCPRFATAFGISPCMRFELLPNYLVWRAVRDRYLVVYEANAKRTLIDVRDMARAYLYIMDHYKEMQGQVYNIGDEVLNVTKRQIVDLVCKLVPGTIVFDETSQKDKDARDYNVSYDKIRDKTSFACIYLLEEGLQQVKVLAELITSSEKNLWRVD